eukprot:3125608-Rhodomonas_salina.1
MQPDSDTDSWLKAEEIEMATCHCYEKGTFKIMDLPDRVVELPSKFQYKLKTGPKCASETVKSLEIYLKLPPGYMPPPGKTARLRHSLHGLKQAPICISLPLSIQNLATKILFQAYLSIYIDDSIAACNNKELCQLFLTDIGKDFELSNQGPIMMSWYLGVSVKQDLTNKHTTLSQEQYVKEVLEEFGMTGATAVSTQMEANMHLTSTDCPPPHKVDKQFKQE